MSKTQPNAQSKKPLGGGEKAESSSNNRILYAVLALLVIIFVWRMTSQEDQTQAISKKDSSPSNLYDGMDENTPNVDVEIVEADYGTNVQPKKHSTSSQTDNGASSANNQEAGNKNPSIASTVQPSASIQPSKKKKNVSSSNESPANVEDNYQYIYTDKVDMPLGTFNGLDADGFARTGNNRVDVDVAVSRFDGKTGRLVQVPDSQLDLNLTQKPEVIEPTFNPRSEPIVASTPKPQRARGNSDDYPTTGIPYGSEAYPLKDTLPWHPYESLAYIREEKEVFVAEKVRNMPTADDLEPYIPPSTLGDRDTRMGFGVVIRPNR